MMGKAKKVVFVEARSPDTHIFSRVNIPRLGSILLGTILREKGYDVKVYVEDISPVDLEDVFTADYVGISTITSTAIRAYELADMARAKGILTIMGGPHVSFMPAEALEHCDYVIRGEGEDSIVELLKALDTGSSPESIKGLSYKQNGAVINNPRGEYECDLDRFPIPDYSLVAGWKKKMPVTSIATSRGCPYGCKFCSVILMFGRRIRLYSIDRVMEEIRRVAHKTKHIFFCDDNFAMDKGRAKELMRRIIAEGLKIEWSTQVRADAAKDEELLDLMKRSGCYIVFIGFESINPHTLAAYQKGQTIDDIEHAIEKFRSFGIHIHGMFVLGSDQDDVETIRATTQFAQSTGIDTVQFLMLTPLPGTPMYDELKEQGRIFNPDWAKYDAHHAVFEPKKMSAYELQVETFKAMKNFYTYKSMLKYLLKLDFFFFYFTWYGMRLAREELKEKRAYEEYLKNLLQNKYLADSKEDKDTPLLQKFRMIGVTNSLIGDDKKRFLCEFLKKLGFTVLTSGKSDKVLDLSKKMTDIEIAPFLDSCKNQIAKLSEKVDCVIMPFAQEIATVVGENKHKFDEAVKTIIADAQKKIISIELSTANFYRMSIELGIALNANLKEVQRAYYKTVRQLQLEFQSA